MKLIQLTYLMLGLFQGSYFALWLPKLQARGFTLAQVALLFSIEIAVSMVLDIPLGTIADRIGHKKITVAGFFIYLIAVLFPSVSTTGMALAIAIVLIGIGNSLVSGALDSWAADLQARHLGDLKAHHFVSRDQLQRIGVITGSLGIPLLVSFVLHEAPRGTWILFVIVAVALIFLSTLTPSGSSPTRQVSSDTTLSESLREVIGAPGFLALTLAWVFFGLSNGAVDMSFYPRLTQEFHLVDSWIFGVIQASVSLSRLAGSELWKRSPWINSWKLPGISVLISSLFFIGYGLIQNPTAALAFWLIRVGVLSVYFSTIVSSVISAAKLKQYRATALSVASVASAAGEVAFTSFLAIHPILPSHVALFGGTFTTISAFFLLRGISRIQTET